MNYKVCHLTASQAARLERNNDVPDCSTHRHIHVDQALSLVTEHEGHGAARWVGSNYRRIVDIPAKSWCKKISGGTAVMQMVRGGRGPVNRPRLANAEA
jgi:hypothetical protein